MEHADFFSLGTNDLTQTTLGFSRDDAEHGFLPNYISSGILESNPFVTVDIAGVGWLIRHVVSSTRAIDPAFSIGVCGEHGGDPASISFFHEIGVGYISCSPFRVPAARLAAAHAAIREVNQSRDRPVKRPRSKQAPETMFEAAGRNGAEVTGAAGRAGGT
jgi:pyruvate,orthophosphate dikinase